jgi:hypothetical protein
MYEWMDVWMDKNIISFVTLFCFVLCVIIIVNKIGKYTIKWMEGSQDNVGTTYAHIKAEYLVPLEDSDNDNDGVGVDNKNETGEVIKNNNNNNISTTATTTTTTTTTTAKTGNPKKRKKKKKKKKKKANTNQDDDDDDDDEKEEEEEDYIPNTIMSGGGSIQYEFPMKRISIGHHVFTKDCSVLIQPGKNREFNISILEHDKGGLYIQFPIRPYDSYVEDYALACQCPGILPDGINNFIYLDMDLKYPTPLKKSNVFYPRVFSHFPDMKKKNKITIIMEGYHDGPILQSLLNMLTEIDIPPQPAFPDVNVTAAALIKHSKMAMTEKLLNEQKQQNLLQSNTSTSKASKKPSGRDDDDDDNDELEDLPPLVSRYGNVMGGDSNKNRKNDIGGGGNKTSDSNWGNDYDDELPPPLICRNDSEQRKNGGTSSTTSESKASSKKIDIVNGGGKFDDDDKFKKRIGVKVLVHGLISRSDLNGLIGTFMGRPQKKERKNDEVRYKVKVTKETKMPNGQISRTNQIFLLKKDNFHFDDDEVIDVNSDEYDSDCPPPLVCRSSEEKKSTAKSTAKIKSDPPAMVKTNTKSDSSTSSEGLSMEHGKYF